MELERVLRQINLSGLGVLGCSLILIIVVKNTLLSKSCAVLSRDMSITICLSINLMLKALFLWE